MFTCFPTDVNTLLILRFYLHDALKLLPTLYEPFPTTWTMYKLYNYSKLTYSFCPVTSEQLILQQWNSTLHKDFPQKKKECDIVLSGEMVCQHFHNINISVKSGEIKEAISFEFSEKKRYSRRRKATQLQSMKYLLPWKGQEKPIDVLYKKTNIK